MVGRPGTGKSMLAEMFREVLERSIGDYLRPQDAIVAFPGKDRNHSRMAYENPETVERVLRHPPGASKPPRTAEMNSAWRLRSAPFARSNAGFGPLPERVLPSALFLPRRSRPPDWPGWAPFFCIFKRTIIGFQEKIQRETGGSLRPMSNISMTWSPRFSTTHARKRISWRASPNPARAT